MDPYDTLGITPAYEGDLKALRNRLVKRYFEAGETPDEERMKAINLAYGMLRDRPRVVAPLEIVSGSLPAARVGEPYRVELAVSGGVAPYTWEAALPRGLALDGGGVLSGRVERTLAFTLKVTDRDGRLVERGLVVGIERPAPPVRIVVAPAVVPERRRWLHPAALATVILLIAALAWLVVAVV
jgi:hypothetical protein